VFIEGFFYLLLLRYTKNKELIHIEIMPIYFHLSIINTGFVGLNKEVSMSIYVGARDLSGLPFGTHQFVVITYSSRKSIKIGRRVYETKLLGHNVYGIVIGAQNRETLKVEMFEGADTLAAQEHFGEAKKTWYKSDYDTEMQLVKFNGSELSLEHESKLISLVDAYLINQSLDPISYLTAGAGYNRRISETYFTPICPSKPRVKLN
jgi:hypothetical protein